MTANRVRRLDAWQCVGCGESCPADFDICWKCGSSFDGEHNENFQAVLDIDDIETDEPIWSVPSWTMRNIAWWGMSVALCIVAATYMSTGAVLLTILIAIIAAPFADRILDSCSTKRGRHPSRNATTAAGSLSTPYMVVTAGRCTC